MKPELRRLDVVLVRARLGYSTDCRPCIVVGLPTPDVAVVLVSASNLFDPQVDFLIDAARPEFKATGLRRTSFAVGRSFVAVPISALGKRLGRLEGDLAREFTAWLARVRD